MQCEVRALCCSRNAGLMSCEVCAMQGWCNMSWRLCEVRVVWISFNVKFVHCKVPLVWSARIVCGLCEVQVVWGWGSVRLRSSEIEATVWYKMEAMWSWGNVSSRYCEMVLLLTFCNSEFLYGISFEDNCSLCRSAFIWLWYFMLVFKPLKCMSILLSNLCATSIVKHYLPPLHDKLRFGTCAVQIVSALPYITQDIGFTSIKRPE